MTARQAACGALIAVLLTCAGCVGPARTSDAYEGKAGTTAAAAVSSARTAVLAVDTQQRDSLTTASLEVLLQESELAVAATAATFDSIQPPDTPQDDQLSRQLGALLTAASDDTRWLRIAARRGDDSQLQSRAASLAATADRLDAFAQEHGS